MKIGLIHFSDIHIKSASDLIITNKEAVSRACKAAVNDCTKVVVAITGDIAFSGTEEQYKVAYDFLKFIEETIRKESVFINQYEYVMVPGNHDCDFTKIPEKGIPRIVRESVKNSDIVEESDVINNCLEPQEAFWQFYSNLKGNEICPTISFSYTVMLTQTKSMHFHCYNTSFVSEVDEKVGALVVPENAFLTMPMDGKIDDIVISIFHHNTGWLSPNTKNNNKKRFEQHLLQTSDVVMCGHEHASTHQLISDITMNDSLTYLEGGSLQNGKDSNFTACIFDTENNNLSLKEFVFAGDYYSAKNTKDVLIKSRKSRSLLNESFTEKLVKIEIPIKHPTVQDLKLSDIFVWQDLETMNESEDHCIQYIDAKDVISKLSGDIIYIEGDSQSGKTSLLNMSFITLMNKGLLPIHINGNELVHPNVTDLLKKKYKQQYRSDMCPYDRYEQIDREKKVVLIDDLHASKLNNEGKLKLLENLLALFNKVIVVTSIQTDIKSYLLGNSDKCDVRRFRLSSLGYHKRNMLIERWVRLGKDIFTSDEYAIEHEVKLTFDQVSNLLGEQLVPAYPVFILSLLQSLNQSFQQYDIAQTSYAFCYKSLIIATLWRSGVTGDKIEGVINILKEFAYSLYQKKAIYFSQDEFEMFYNTYSNKYMTFYSVDKLLEILVVSNIFKKDEDSLLSFSYRYILYYLIARKIAVLEDKEVQDSIVRNLCANIHEEQSANIMIFLIHHTGNKDIIDNLLFTSMLPFEDSAMATLEITDPLFRDLTGLVEEIKSEVLIENTDAKEERAKELKKTDEIQRRTEYRDSLSDVEDAPELRDLNNVFKIIRILGQIVKNQTMTFEKDRLVTIVEEAYKAGFRAIGFFTKMIDDNKEDIVRFFIEENHKHRKFDDKELEQRVHKLLRVMMYRNCLSTFSNLSYAVGNSGMSNVYDEVANRIGSPAAKVVSFTIKSYYNKMKLSDLRDLVNEFAGNPVVMEIIRARVIRYVYHNQVDYSTRQSIGQICGLKLINNPRLTSSQISHSAI